jgi:hypothetical protein
MIYLYKIDLPSYRFKYNIGQIRYFSDKTDLK